MKCTPKIQNEKVLNMSLGILVMRHVSIPMLEAYQKLDIKSILKEEEILGHECFTEEFIVKYKTENILDINPQLF